MTGYEIPTQNRNCQNCIHYDKPLAIVMGKSIGGCREKFDKAGLPRPHKFYCGQWYGRPFGEDDY